MKFIKCTKCGVGKHFDEFHRCSTNKNGRACRCKKCVSIHAKKYYEKNNEEINDRQKKYRENNKEKNAKRQQKYQKDNKDKIKEYSKKYYQDNKDKILKRQKKYVSENTNIYKKWRAANKEKVAKDKIIFGNSPASYSSAASKKISWCDYTEKGETGLLIVKCTYCGKKFTPTNQAVHHRDQAINDQGRDSNGFYCSSGCKKSCPVFRRRIHYKGQKIDGSSREVQPELRQMCLSRDNYTCQKCNANGKTIQLHCHHIKAVIDDPLESADVDNTITLCKSCHKLVHKIAGCRYHELRC